MGKRRLNAFGIVVEDMARSVAFYRALGLPFADGAEQDRVAVLAADHRVGRQRITGFIDGDATDQVFVENKAVTVTLRDAGQHLARRLGDFRPDTVAGQQGDQGVQGRCSSNETMASRFFWM